jgi:hypothetical protein
MIRAALAAALAAGALLATAAAASAAPSAPVLSPLPARTALPSVVVSWSPSLFDPGSTARQYHLRIADSGATQKRSLVVPATTTSFTLGLTPGHTYGIALFAQETLTSRRGPVVITRTLTAAAPAGASVTATALPPRP